MRIIPVLDLKGGQAVHAVAGERARYRPLRSRFAPEPDPVALARAMREQIGTNELYLADLDAITDRAEPAWATLAALAELGLSVWADVGITDGAEVVRLIEVGVERIIVGLESGRGPEILAGIVRQVGADRVAWSLDLRAGLPIVAPAATWCGDSGSESNLIAQAVGAGIKTIIRLDLARVGTGQGVADIPPVPTEWPAVEWITGGGVTGQADLDGLAKRGYQAALVGSALHDGRLDIKGAGTNRGS